MRNLLVKMVSVALAAAVLIGFGGGLRMDLQVSAEDAENTAALEEDTEEFIPVYTIEDLYNIRNDLDANYRLMNDIDLTEATAKGGDWDFMGNGWNPIGSNDVYGGETFTGIFDGGGHTIKGMRIEVAKWPAGVDKTVFLGLFARVSGKVYSLSISGSIEITVNLWSIIDTGRYNYSMYVYAGGIAGYSSANIANCYNMSNISTTYTLEVKNGGSTYITSYAGGIAGFNNGLITNCHNTGNISGSAYCYGYFPTTPSATSYAGGITGYSEECIDNCYNTGSVLSTTKSAQYQSPNIEIRCSATSRAGGITGYSITSITNCYNAGNIDTSTTTNSNGYGASSGYSGGIAGQINYGSIISCYNTGTISRGRGIAHLLSATIMNSYYLAGTGSSSVGAVSLTDAQMRLKSMYQGFDFDTIWTINSHDGYFYPQLQENRQTSGEHVFGSWQIRSPASCTQGGTEFRVCACGAEETKNTAALGHSFTQYISNGNATCTENGTETAKCDRCDATHTRTVENSALGHNYADLWTTDKDPTCTEPGSKSHHCTRCGDKADITAIPALGHSFTHYVSDGNATCTKNGTETAKCDRCGINYTRTDEDSALGHSFTIYVSDGNATCTEDGTKTAKCDRCGITDTQTDTGSALGHSYGEWVIDIEPTCTEPGSKSRHCIYCGDRIDETSIPALGHSFTRYVSDCNATCTEDGTKTAKCDRCGITDTQTDTGSALGHSYGEWVIDIEPTATESGYRHRTCERCGEQQEEEIPAMAILLGDVDGNGAVDITDVMATCKILARAAGGTPPTPAEVQAGDLDGSGAVDILDVMAICKILANQNENA